MNPDALVPIRKGVILIDIPPRISIYRITASKSISESQLAFNPHCRFKYCCPVTYVEQYVAARFQRPVPLVTPHAGHPEDGRAPSPSPPPKAVCGLVWACFPVGHPCALRSRWLWSKGGSAKRPNEARSGGEAEKQDKAAASCAAPTVHTGPAVRARERGERRFR